MWRIQCGIWQLLLYNGQLLLPRFIDCCLLVEHGVCVVWLVPERSALQSTRWIWERMTCKMLRVRANAVCDDSEWKFCCVAIWLFVCVYRPNALIGVEVDVLISELRSVYPVKICTFLHLVGTLAYNMRAEISEGKQNIRNWIQDLLAFIDTIT